MFVVGVVLTNQAVVQSQSASKKETKMSPVLTVASLKPSPTQVTPSLSAPTVTTQVRSRPLPAILPAPPKPSNLTQVPVSVSTTSTVRKLPTLLPAPAKNLAVFPTVLVPMPPAVGSHTGSQLHSSVPLAVTAPVTTGISVLNEVVGKQQQQQPTPVVSASQDTTLTTSEQGNLPSKAHEMNESSEVSEASSSKVLVLSEQSVATEHDNNTSSEDDSILMCSETIDSGCNITEVPSALDFFTNMTESTQVKGQGEQSEQSADVVPQAMLESTTEHETILDPLSLQDIEVSVSDLDTGNVTQEDLIRETKPCEPQQESAAQSIENVTVERLDDTREISELIRGDLSDNIYSETLQMVDHEEEKTQKPELVESDLCSSPASPLCEGENEVIKGDELPVENTGLPVDSALQIIESFVESMEANSGEKSDDLQLGLLESSSVENSTLSEVPTTENENVICEQTTETEPDKSFSQGQTTNILHRLEEENWDVCDAPIDVLSTSTSSSNSASESTELTEKEIKALEAIGNIRTSGRKRKPPTSLDVSPLRQVSGWVRGALRYIDICGLVWCLVHILVHNAYVRFVFS